MNLNTYEAVCEILRRIFANVNHELFWDTFGASELLKRWRLSSVQGLGFSLGLRANVFLGPEEGFYTKL